MELQVNKQGFTPDTTLFNPSSDSDYVLFSNPVGDSDSSLNDDCDFSKYGVSRVWCSVSGICHF